MKNLKTLLVVLLLITLVLFGMIARCLYLQHFKRDHYMGESMRAIETTVREKPCRGVIMDSRGRVLAASNRVETLFGDRNAMDDIEEVAMVLSPILAQPADEISKLIHENANPGYIKIYIGIDPNARKEFLALKPKPKGVGLISDFKRQYPSSDLASHVVGFVDANDMGQGGVELEYNKQLTGTSGANVFYLDGARRLVKIKEQKNQVRDGMGLILTLDSTIQQFARSALYKQYKTYQAESAVAIVMDPYTGAVLALVSLPDFNPAEVGQADRNTWRNRALTDPYEPGSIFKPIVAAIALDSKAIGQNTVINCENGTYSGKGFGTIGEYNHHRYGNLTVTGIITVSSNIGMAKMGQKMGKDKLYKGLREFGLGQITGIDLPGEGSGVLWPLRTWTGYSVTRIPYGQEISVTALQMAKAFCILSNGGRPVRPHVLKAVVEPNGTIHDYPRPELPDGHVIDPKVAKFMVEKAMVAVVNDDHGTGHNAALEKWQVYGKTGTANIAKTGERGFSDMDYVASFAGGAPAEKPAVVVLVSVRKPNRRLGKGYTGGTVAAPVVREILENTLTYMEQKGMIPPAKAPKGEKVGHKPAGVPDTSGGF